MDDLNRREETPRETIARWAVEYRSFMRMVAMRWGASKDDAPDVVQDVLWSESRRVQGGGDLPDDEEAWLYDLVRRRTISLWRMRRARIEGQRRREPLFDSTHPTDENSPEDAAMRKEWAERVRKAVADRDATDRAIAELRFVERWKINEIARAMELGEWGVKKRVAKLTGILRDHLYPASG